MSLETPNFSDPASVVEAFIRAMHGWEAFAGTLGRTATARFRPDGGSSMHPTEARLGELYKQIPPFLVEIFLTKRPVGYAPSCSYSIPPEYDPATETVTRVTPKTKTQVVVETDRKVGLASGPREYVLKLQDGMWLIDSASYTLLGKKRKFTLI